MISPGWKQPRLKDIPTETNHKLNREQRIPDTISTKIWRPDPQKLVGEVSISAPLNCGSRSHYHDYIQLLHYTFEGTEIQKITCYAKTTLSVTQK